MAPVTPPLIHCDAFAGGAGTESENPPTAILPLIAGASAEMEVEN